MDKINNIIQDTSLNTIKKLPFNGRSKYLIDKFYILGYEEKYLKKQLIDKEIPQIKSHISRYILNEEDYSPPKNKDERFSPHHLNIPNNPTLINEISNDFKKKMPDIDLLNDMIFPDKVNLYYKEFKNFDLQAGRATTMVLSPNNKNKNKFKQYSLSTDENINLYQNEENSDLEQLKSKEYNMVFSYNPQSGENSKKSINGFAYVFYKKCNLKKSIKGVKFEFYVPITFCIISEYPYFNSYHKLCKQLTKLFMSKNNKIPLEIIIYNIVNFTLSPINGDIYLNIEPLDIPFPSIKQQIISSKTKQKKIYSSNYKNNQMQIIEEEIDDIIDKNPISYSENKKPSKNNQIENNINNNNINHSNPTSKSPTRFHNSINFKVKNYFDFGAKSPEVSRTTIQLKNINSDRMFNKKNLFPFNNWEEINNDDIEDSEEGSLKEIKFPVLSGYPLIQYNLTKVLLEKLTPQDVIIIFFYTFLEKDVIFFSKNLEYLSLTINSYLNLNFPLNDEKYYFFNACVSYENLIRENSTFVGTTFTSILGVNSSYKSEYLSKMKSRDHLAVDLDNGILHNEIDSSDKERHARNKTILDFIKKICKKEIRENNNIILAREVKFLYEKLEKYKNNLCFQNLERYNYLGYYDENADDLKKIRYYNREIQDDFYRLIINMSIYFYQNLSLKSENNKNKNNNENNNENNKNNIINNRSNKDTESMNIIFHKDYNNFDSNNISDIVYTREEKCFLDELCETMKFESFVYGFIQSYNPIDLYKIPLTTTEEFISILSRKNVLADQTINFYELIDKLYKSNGLEKTYVDFNPFSIEYFKKFKKYFDREIHDNFSEKNTKSIGLNYLMNEEGKIIDSIKYNNYYLNDDILLKYIRILKNLPKDEYYHMFHLATSLEQNKFKNITLNDIENEIEKFCISSEILSKNDICCSNIILLFVLNIKLLRNYIAYQSFLSALFQNFVIFRKYYTIIMNVVYRLMNDCLDNEDYSQAQNYFFCYYSCINSIIGLKLVPNENLMNIIQKFEKISLNNLLAKSSKSVKSTGNTPLGSKNYMENNSKFVYVTYNFTKNGIIKENEIIKKVNENKSRKTLTINTGSQNKKTLKPKIKYNGDKFKYECFVVSQEQILNDLGKLYDEYINELDDSKLDNKTNNKIIFEACLNILIFIRNSEDFKDKDDIIDAINIIFNIYLDKIQEENENQK